MSRAVSLFLAGASANSGLDALVLGRPCGVAVFFLAMSAGLVALSVHQLREARRGL